CVLGNLTDVPGHDMLCRSVASEESHAVTLLPFEETRANILRWMVIPEYYYSATAEVLYNAGNPHQVQVDYLGVRFTQPWVFDGNTVPELPNPVTNFPDLNPASGRLQA